MPSVRNGPDRGNGLHMEQFPRPEGTDLMIPLNLVRHLAAALVSLLGYPRTIGDELRGRMLG